MNSKTDKTEFRLWREQLSLTVEEAAVKLGIGYERVKQLDRCRDGKNPKLTIRLAMTAIAKNQPPWKPNV